MLDNFDDICWQDQFFTQQLLIKFMFADFATCIIVCPEWIYNGQTSYTSNYIKHVLTVLWYLLQVWLSQNPTCLAMCSSVTRDASTCVRIDSVGTSCPIHTRAATAFVNIYKSNVTFWQVKFFWYLYNLLCYTTIVGSFAPEIIQTDSFGTINVRKLSWHF